MKRTIPQAPPPTHIMSEIHYHAVPVEWTREEKLRYLAKTSTLSAVAWTDIEPNKKHQWLTGDLRAEFDGFMPMGRKSGKSHGDSTVFRTHTMGMSTNRDSWIVNFSAEQLKSNVIVTIDAFNDHIQRWEKLKKKPPIDDFVDHDDSRISWSSSLKMHMARSRRALYDGSKIRPYLYRPFGKQCGYFDEVLVHRISGFPTVFPKVDSRNVLICVTDCASEKPFMALATSPNPTIIRGFKRLIRVCVR